jgi:cytolysin-activating lysine-acyltransferase
MTKLSKDGILGKLSIQKKNLLVGEITSLLMLSKVHRLHQVRDIADIILPAINLNQFRIYRNAKKESIALVTWAYFSKEVEKEYLKGKGVLSEKELKSGDIIYMTDFIAPFGHTKKIIKELQTKVFPNDEVNALRFIEQGKARSKLWKFHGVNYKKKLN